MPCAFSTSRLALAGCTAGLLAVCCALADDRPATSTAPGRFACHDSPYYVIHSDLPPDEVAEAAARLTAMAEEYQRRTSGFAGRLKARLPFYLFSQAADYHAAGGPAGTSGMYDGKRLLAAACKDDPQRVWQVIQHEGFHQFAHVAMGGRLPAWLNEGLAEYFGCGIWTGDAFVTGLIPPSRLARLKERIAKGDVVPFPRMLQMNQEQWTAALSGANYDQAWSMVHFLVHGRDEKHRRAFAGFIEDVSRGRSGQAAFHSRFGRDLKPLEASYRTWWSSLPEDPTCELRTQALVGTLTSFLARAASQGQHFSDAEAFFQAARDGSVKAPPSQPLPRRLLTAAVGDAGTLGHWSIEGDWPAARLVLRRQTGASFTGSFSLNGGLVAGVNVEVRPAPPEAPMTPAASQGQR